MAGIVTLSLKSTLTTVRDEFRHTASRLNTHKLTKTTLAPTFMAFLPKLVLAEQEEEDLKMQHAESEAEAEFMDDDLDGLVDEVVAVTGNTRGTALYKEFFGTERVFEFKRPVLNEQLDAMRTWPEVLENKTEPKLVQIREMAETLIRAAEEVTARKKALEARMTVFRETGTRPQLVAEFNALRKSIHGELAKLQHENHLGSGWAESFFRQGSNQALNLRQVERRIAATEEQLAYLQGVRQELLAKQAAAEETARLAEERGRQARIASKLEQLAKLQAELDELRGDE